MNSPFPDRALKFRNETSALVCGAAFVADFQRINVIMGANGSGNRLRNKTNARSCSQQGRSASMRLQKFRCIGGKLGGAANDTTTRCGIPAESRLTEGAAH
jgi:hypothetical protein